MLKLNFGRRSRLNVKLGELYNGYYFPSVLLGRTEAYANDVELLLREVISNLDSSHISVYETGTFRVFSCVFSRWRFSQVLSVTELEDANDAFDILVGTIANLLRHLTSPSDNIGSVLSSLVKRDRRAVLLNLDDDEDRVITLLQCLLIYLLFCLGESQYVKIPVYNSSLQSNKPRPFNLSLETLNLISTIVQRSQRWQLCSEVSVVVDRLMFCDRHLVKICLFDGPQYFYQDRYGMPLPFGFDKVLSKCIDQCAPNETELQELNDQISSTSQQIEQAVEELNTLRGALSETQYCENGLKELLNESHRLVETRTNALKDQFLETSVESPHPMLFSQSQLSSRLAELQGLQGRSTKRVRRTYTSHRNPSGLASTTAARTTRRKSLRISEVDLESSDIVKRSDSFDGEQFKQENIIASDETPITSLETSEHENEMSIVTENLPVQERETITNTMAEETTPRNSFRTMDDDFLLELLTERKERITSDETAMDLEDELLKPSDMEKERSTSMASSDTAARLEAELFGEIPSLVEQSAELRRRKKAVIKPEMFINPFDLEFEAMLADDVVEEKKPKRKTTKQKAKKKSTFSEYVVISDENSEREDERTSVAKIKPDVESKRSRQRKRKLPVAERETKDAVDLEVMKSVLTNVHPPSTTGDILHPSTAIVHWEEGAEEKDLPSQSSNDHSNVSEADTKCAFTSDELLLKELEDVIMNLDQ